MDAVSSDVLKKVEAPDYPGIRDAFCRELELAADNKAQSLPFIRYALPAAPIVQPGQIFQAFVIGGTNSEIATILYNVDGTAEVIDYHVHYEMERFKKASDLLSFIDKHVDAIADAIAINFAFPLSPIMGGKGQLDGILAADHDIKGHTFVGLRGKPVGAAIEAYFKRKHHREIVVSVVNDAVCLVASTIEAGSNRDQLLGGIVGTGYNLAFFLDKNTIVNVEAKEFKGFTPTESGRIVDAQSKDAGKQLYGKEVAAGELFKHYNTFIKDLKLKGGRLKSSKELATLAITDEGVEGDLARALFRRSASLVAAQLAGFYNFRKRPTNVIAVMEGSLFWEGQDYKEMLVEKLGDLGVPASAFVFEMLYRSGVIGITKLVTGDCGRL